MTLNTHEVVCNVDVEPDSLSLSPLPKEKIPLGPFVPIPLDAHLRIIQPKSPKKTANAITQVTEELLCIENNRLCKEFGEMKVKLASDDSHIKLRHGSETSEENAVLSPTPRDGALDTAISTDLIGSRECKECGVIPVDLKDHFLGKNTPANLQLKCKSCNMILPTNCSLQAHERIHTQKKPYICPECVREFDLWAAFSVHLVYSCFHLAKTVYYRCRSCKELFPSSVALEVHLLTQHLKHVYKCNACPIACFSVQALNDHKMSIHKQSSPVAQAYQQCQLCPDRLIPKSRILFHINEHIRERYVRLYVYHCGDCNFFAVKRSDFAAHKSVCSKNDSMNSLISHSSDSEKSQQNDFISGNTIQNNSLNNSVQQKILIPVNGNPNNRQVQNKVLNSPDNNQINNNKNNNNNIVQQKLLIPVDGSPNSNSVQQKLLIPVDGSPNSNSVQQKLLIPVDGSPNSNSVQHKVTIPLDSKQKNISMDNCYKVVYTVPNTQKTMQLTLLPRTYIKNVKKVVLPQQQERKLLPKFTVGQISMGENLTQNSNVNGVSVNEQLSGKKDMCINVKKSDTNAEESETALPSVVSSSKSVNKVASSQEAVNSAIPETIQSSGVRQGTILRLCALCKRELVIIPHGLGMTNFQALCVNCSKTHTFLKTDNKLMIVSRNKTVKPDKMDTQYSNGKMKFPPQMKKVTSLLSPKKTTNFKKKVNIALNGPTGTKKLSSPGDGSDSDRYRCHICKDLISMDWEKIQEHFSEKHPNFNLLVLSPRINKLNFKSIKTSCIVKDNKIYSKDIDDSNSESNNDDRSECNYESENMANDFDDCDNEMGDFIKEYDNSDGGESLENDTFYESFRYMKRERDIPIDYDLIPSKLKKKKRSHKDKDAQPSGPFSSGQVVPRLETTLTDLKYQCAKCEYSDENVESFHEHIVKHRTDKNVIQCMECGLCFVVKPSFEKHLFISHRIKDVASYMQNNNCYNDVVSSDKTDEISLNNEIIMKKSVKLVENQCRVCREIFDTSLQLNKHFRTHGMAFLLMKKRENKTP